MLKFYYHPLSPVARRVWWTLLEKEIPFEPIVVDLRGQQHQPEYLAVNPFHHVPVIVKDGFTLIESIAILDYLETQYPSPSFWPTTALEQATARMLQMVTVNELMPQTRALINAEIEPLSTERTQALTTVCNFYESHLDHRPYFGGEHLDLADIVVGSTLPLLNRCGMSLASHPQLEQWCQHIRARSAWQATEPSERDFGLWRRWIQRAMGSKQK